MSSRLHSKYHRHNHHTSGIVDPRYPDASHDPIASYDSPFLGDFVLLGTLSATGTNQTTSLPGQPGAIFTPGSGTNVAIEARGDISLTGNLSAAAITFTGNVLQTFTTPITANGDFLEVNINGQIKYVRLWNS
jgi:hypothetical protein